jgi:hypothetical protein
MTTLDEVLLEVSYMTPAVIRAAAITAAKRLGAPTGAVNQLIEMEREAEWSFGYAFLDDDEEWFDRKCNALISATLIEASKLIAGMETAAAMAAEQQVEVWLAWKDKVEAMMKDAGLEFGRRD